ncbi:MAG TPA: sulfurtransferase TusA family protein, partial [Candidatus Dormibacteraeota bacterium]|nr:sulfurtransferase TusA family protein [Candidatus Dormibacteraeota bacterium]
MPYAERHPYEADASFDGGDLDCGNGLLLLIRQHIDPLEPGQLLEFRSTEISVEEDFPAWCRMTGNELVSTTRDDRQRSFLVCKGPLSGRQRVRRSARAPLPIAHAVVDVRIPAALPPPAPAPAIHPLSVMGIGSWPRPRWMLTAIHDR